MRRKTIVAFVSQPWELPSAEFAFGGIPGWTYQIARRLARDCEVTVYARRRDGAATEVVDQAVRFRNLSARGFPRVLEPLWRRLPLRVPYFASTLFNLVYAVKVAAEVRKRGCGVVHIHNFSQFAPIIRALNPGIKIVLHMHCEWLSQLDRQVMQHRLRQVDLVLGCSEHITQGVRRAFPGYASRCQTVYNGVDVEQFARPDPSAATPTRRQAARVIYVGRVSPEKGVHVLVDAFHDAARRYPTAELYIVGPEAAAPLDYVVRLTDEPRVKELERFYPESYVAQLHRRISAAVAHQVVFTGPRPHGDIVEQLRMGDLFVHPAVWDEPFGMTIIEAMAAGVPVIASRAGGPAEYIEHGRTGWLVEPGDVRDLAEAIVGLLSNDELRTAIGRAGQQQALARFSWDHVADQLRRAYARLWDDSPDRTGRGGAP